MILHPMQRFLLGAILLLIMTTEASALEKKVLVIGVDGLRPDQMLLANTPSIDALIAGGSLSTSATNVGPSWSGYSGPNWSSMLTGVTPGDHGVLFNFAGSGNIDDDNFGAGDFHSVFGYAKDYDPTIQTASLNHWNGIGVGPSSILENSQSVLDVKIAAGEPFEPGDVTDDASIRTAVSDLLLGQGDYLGTGENPDLLFVHFGQVDSAGHANAYDSAAYRTAIETADALVGDVMNAVNSRSNIANEDWLIILSADHGGPNGGFDHGSNADLNTRTIPFIVSGDSALLGDDLGNPEIYDVVPTALHHLGVDISGLPLAGSITGLTPDYAANASFSTGSDLDVLSIDLGTYNLGDAATPIGFDLANLTSGILTADLLMDNLVGSGDTSALSTNLASFASISAGSSTAFESLLDTSAPGDFSATYTINLTDDLGTDQMLTLNLSGVVDNVDHPDAPDLLYNPVTGEVTLDATEAPGGVITIYTLKSDGGFIEEEFNPFLGSFVTDSDIQLGEGPNLSGVGGQNEIGEVFPAGMDITELHNFLTDRTVVGSLGSGNKLFDLFVVCTTGDADCDGDVDLDDVISAVGSFTGPCTVGVDCAGDPGNGGSAFTKVRNEGDVNNGAPVEGVAPLSGDGDVDLDDIIDMVGAFTGPMDDEGGLVAAEGGDAGLPDLIYDSATGEVFLDATDIGGTLQAYNIKNADGMINTTPAFTPILGGAPATDLATEIGEFQLSSTPTPLGGLRIGFVFPAGMDQAQLEAFVTGCSAAPAFGGGSFAWDLIATNVVESVPEPASVALLAIGMVGVLGLGLRRRSA